MRLELEGVEQLLDRLGHAINGIHLARTFHAGWHHRKAVPGQVHRDHGVARGERGGTAGPGVRAAAGTMEQEHHWPRSLPLVVPPDACAIQKLGEGPVWPIGGRLGKGWNGQM